MMIEKILRIQNVGLLQDACASEKPVLDRVAGIFADNGRGKSTLAAILRACHLTDSNRLRVRKTIDSDDPPQLDFLLPNGSHLTFNGSTWSGTSPEILVFDSEFIEQNVYSGFEVRTDQRQELLSFALGNQTVQLTRNVEQLTQQISEQTTKRSQAEKELTGCMQPYGITEFIALVPVPDAQVQIDALRKRVEAAKNTAQLTARQEPSTLPAVDFDTNALFTVLAKDLADVENSAEAVVRAHLASRSHDQFEEWISRGQQYLTSDDCPFCGQLLNDLDLIRAYRTYFNEEYRALKTEVTTLERGVKAAFAPDRVDALAAAAETNHARIQAWADQLQVDIPELDQELLRVQYSKNRELLLSLIAEKEKEPFKSVGDGEGQTDVEVIVARINEHLSRYNSEIKAVAQQIAEFKQSLANEDTSLLKAEIRKLEAALKRQQPEVIAAIAEYQSAEAEKKRLEVEKKSTRKKIDGLMAETLTTYQGEINQLLTTFGAEFSIEALQPSYVGSGRPRTEYAISLRKNSVKLGTRSDAANGPSFATALSEADKRTLAFAFFVARLNQDGELLNKVVVLDDPVSSLDRNRRHNSIRLICDLAARCGQLLVLSHAAYFVRDLRDALANAKPAAVSFPIWTLKRAQQQYSVFERCDIDDICASSYYRHHRLVSDYVAGTSTVDAREVAKALRPLLEGYYHRRFPGCIPKRQMFGQIIALAVDPTTTGPLVNLRPLETELRAVNDYAGQFHHDTSQSADTAQVVDAELRLFAKHTLKLIYENG